MKKATTEFSHVLDFSHFRQPTEKLMLGDIHTTRQNFWVIEIMRSEYSDKNFGFFRECTYFLEMVNIIFSHKNLGLS